MNIIIIDNNKDNIDLISKNITRFFSQLHMSISIYIFSCLKDYDSISISCEIAFCSLKNNNLIVNYHDILTKLQPSINQIVIVTGNDDSLQAYSYFIHPFFFLRFNLFESDFKFLEKLLIAHIEQFKFTPFIVVKGRRFRLLLSEIEYIENYGHQLIIHTSKESFEFRSSLKDFMQACPKQSIVQIQKSLAIPLIQVKSYNKSILFTHFGLEFKISPIYLSHFIKSYNYCNNILNILSF